MVQKIKSACTEIAIVAVLFAARLCLVALCLVKTRRQAVAANLRYVAVSKKPDVIAA